MMKVLLLYVGGLAPTGSELFDGKLQSQFQPVNDTSVQAVIEILKETLRI